jgi:hypothetical protein
MCVHYKKFFIICIAILVLPGKMAAQCTGDFSGNLITNGDFESGNAGVSSAYNYVAPGSMGIGDWTVTPPLNSGAYRPPTNNGVSGDHTKGNNTGHYMLLDPSNGTLNAWFETVNVVPSTTYYFSAWVSNVNYINQNPAQLKFAVGGTQIGSIFSAAAPAGSGLEADMDHNWYQFTATWNSGATSGPVMVSMVNLTSSAGTGDDLGLDDVTFSSSCKFVTYPVTSVMPDTMSLCNTGGSVLLNSQISPAGNTFTWTTGGSTIAGATGPSYTASAAGKYYLCYELTGTNCPKSDSVIVLANKFYINLGPNVTLCNPPNLTLDAGVTAPPVKVRWYKNNALIGYDSVSQLAVNAPGIYRAEAYLPSTPGCGTGISSVTITSTTTAVPNNAIFCPSKSVSLSVTGSGTYVWYANSTGSTLAAGTQSGANGQNFTTNVISTSMTYYVEDQTVFETGNFTPKTRFSGSYSGTSGGNTNQGTSFTASAPFRLDSVTVFSKTYGIPPVGSPKTVTVTLYSGTPPALTLIASKVVTLNVTDPVSGDVNPYQLYLGFSIPAAGNYYLEYSGGTAEIDGSDANNSTTANYPSYKVPGVIQLNGVVQKNGSVNSYWNDKYLYFYNWIIGAGTLCGRVPVYATADCALPVSLMDLKAEKHNNSIILSWATSSEINNDYFSIEKSEDGIHFSYIGKVNGHGNSSIIQQYYFSDYSPYNGLSYYRIKQVDYNGNTSYSNAIPVNFDKTDELISILNTTSGIKINYKSSINQNITVQVISAIGQEIYNNQHILAKGTNEFEIPLSVADALYIINIFRENGEYERKKIVK